MAIGLMAAMPDEIALLKEHLQSPSVHSYAGREFYQGILFGKEVVLVLSRIGKVAAAVTTAILLDRFPIDFLLFTGVAGAGHEGVNVGDVVVADALIQHDMDVRPYYRQHEVPIHGKALFETEVQLTAALCTAANDYLASGLPQALLKEFTMTAPKVWLSCIASGDQFICDATALKAIHQRVKNIQVIELACVEMEGAAVAQVCLEFEKPCVVMRTISDNANHDAAVDFIKFLKQVASHYSFGIVKQFFKGL